MFWNQRGCVKNGWFQFVHFSVVANQNQNLLETLHKCSSSSVQLCAQRVASPPTSCCQRWSFCLETFWPMGNRRLNLSINQSQAFYSATSNIPTALISLFVHCLKTSIPWSLSITFTLRVSSSENWFEPRKHVMTHTGETPHKCGFCGKGFRRKDTLKKHEVLEIIWIIALSHV